MASNTSIHSREQLAQDAMRYAEFDKSNPFALSVALSHVKNGICDPIRTEGQMKPGGYNAEYQEVDGKVSYFNLARS